MIPTAEDFFELHIQRGVNNTHSKYLEVAIKFTKLHCIEEAKVISETKVDGYKERKYDRDPVDKESILTAYPLNLIK